MRLVIKVSFEFKDQKSTYTRSKKVTDDPCNYVYKVEEQAELIKVIGGREQEQISALSFGPYDNGYVLTGLQSGRLLVLDWVTLERIHDFPVFTGDNTESGEPEKIKKITMEPTELVVVSSD